MKQQIMYSHQFFNIFYDLLFQIIFLINETKNINDLRDKFLSFFHCFYDLLFQLIFVIYETTNNVFSSVF